MGIVRRGAREVATLWWDGARILWERAMCARHAAVRAGPARLSKRAPRLLAATLVLGMGLLAPAPRARADYDPVYAITVWAQRYGLSAAYLIGVAQCESSLDPSATNPSGAYGLFQFVPATFTWGETLMNNDPTDATMIDWRGIDSVGAQAHVAAYLFAHGYAYLWACA